ncbi:glycoside hydrolase family 3 protein [Agromyces sp. MMS24-JH15]|uniref:glycoside hydrolase family 3 protein n=1 Tax=Agromyces sp. MMS24-JH15 TaxID=3243765 RepID=UPI003749F4C4
MNHAAPSGAGGGLRRDILTTLLPGFTGPAAPDWVLARLRDGLGGVCLFGSNVVARDQLAALCAELRGANPAAVVAIDEEGGDVTRLYYDRGAPWPGNAVLGRLDDPSLTEAVGREVGEALRALGVTMTFAPDADVNSNPENPVIGTRSFGADPALAARHTAAWVRGVQSTGVDASAKHFPGHGDTSADSHLALPVVDAPLEVLRERELVPFRAAIAAGVRSIMTSHIVLPHLDAEHPVTLSPNVLRRLLRGELGYAGVVVSDALDMHGASGVHGIPEAAVRALVAGCDLLCIGPDITEAQVDEIVAAVEAAVAAGRLDADRVAEAAGRVRALADGGSGTTDAATGGPTAADTASAVGVDDVLRAFDLVDGALAPLRGAGSVGTVVRVDTVPNIAVGIAPWGPFAAEASDAPSWLSAAETVALDAAHPLADPAALAGPVVVIGKDLHRFPFAVDAIAALRAARDDVVTVDLGWPSDDRAVADVSGFGASRLVGEAVIRLVGDALGADAAVTA